MVDREGRGESKRGECKELPDSEQKDQDCGEGGGARKGQRERCQGRMGRTTASGRGKDSKGITARTTFKQAPGERSPVLGDVEILKKMTSVRKKESREEDKGRGGGSLSWVRKTQSGW